MVWLHPFLYEVAASNVRLICEPVIQLSENGAIENPINSNARIFLCNENVYWKLASNNWRCCGRFSGNSLMSTRFASCGHSWAHTSRQCLWFVDQAAIASLINNNQFLARSCEQKNCIQTQGTCREWRQYYLPRKCKRSLAIDKLVCILSCKRCARSQTSPRPPQQSTAIPYSNSRMPFRYSSIATSFWPMRLE